MTQNDARSEEGIGEVASGDSKRLHRVCPACGRENRSEERLRYSRDDWDIKSCGACGFVYLENPVSYEALGDDFAWEKTYEQETERRKEKLARSRTAISSFLKGVKYRLRPGRHVKVRRFIERFIPQGRLLDVGCGHGKTILDLDDRYIPFGVEISPALAETANENMRPRGGRVVVAAAVDGTAEFEDEYFDGVVMRAFLEHEVEPVRLLEQVRRVLKPGGVTIIKVPNFASLNRRIVGETWCGFRFPDHVNYFTPRSLRSMVESAGLEVTSHERRPFNDNMWLVAIKPPGATATTPAEAASQEESAAESR